VTDRGERREVSEIVPAEEHRARGAFRGEPPQGGPLVHAGRPEFQHQPTGFDGERGPLG
jgi:hypothetical protein